MSDATVTKPTPITLKLQPFDLGGAKNNSREDYVSLDTLLVP